MWLKTRKVIMDDDQLLQAYYEGDRDAIGSLFERHATTVYGACLFYFREKERARDAVMQIFEKLLSVLSKEKVRKFEPWLSCVCRNYCISELRKDRARWLLNEGYLDFEIHETSFEREERIASVSDDTMLQYLEESLPELKEMQRLCLTDFYLGNLSYKEISEKNGLSLPEVKSHIQNAKRNMKLLIEERIRNEKVR